MKALTLIALGLTGRAERTGRLASVSVSADVQPVSHLVATDTPLGLVIAAERSPEADPPEVFTSRPVLAARGVVLHGGQALLAGGP